MLIVFNLQSSKVVAIDEKMLATGVLDSTKPGDALNFEQGTLEDTSSHRTIGSTFLEHGVGTCTLPHPSQHRN